MNTSITPFLRAILWILTSVTIPSDLEARAFRPARIPNGTVSNCQNCHTSPFGGGPRNAFGAAVFTTIGGTSADVAFWNAALAALDSDNDGFTNGQELGDIDGDGIPERTTGISNPGDAGSLPVLPNTAPSFTSAPIVTATKGLPYQYQASADDPENGSVTFTKFSGPSWLTVAGNGLVSGTPPDNANATEAVTIRATDNGAPSAFTDQSYTLNITAAFRGWQRLNFGAGENDPDSAPTVDGEGDQVPNFIEYALRANPRAATGFAFPLSFNGGQQASCAIDVRDDDPALTVTAEISNKVDFSNPTTVNAVPSDPTPNDGFKRLTFTDPIANSGGVHRFVRLKFSNGQ